MKATYNREAFERRYVQKGIWKNETLGEAFERWSRDYGSKLAVIDGDKTYTYKQMNIRINRLATGFEEMGIKKGDRVVVQLPNSTTFIETAFALFKLGALPVMVLPAHRENELIGIFEKSQAQVYIIQDAYLGFDYRQMAESLMSRVKTLQHIIVDGDSQSFVNIKDLYKKEEKQIFEFPAFDDTGMLLLSGGTTGIPKLIPRRHTDYLYVAKESAKRCGMDSDTVYLAALPMAHNFPLGCPGIVGAFEVGGTVVISSVTSPDEILGLIEEEGVTVTGLVPSMANLCAEFLEDDDYDMSSMKVIQIGGSVLDKYTAQKVVQNFDCTLQQIFGMAEGLICTTKLDDPLEVVLTCQGTPISEEDEIRIVNEADENLEPGESGELITRGPYTIYGYYELPQVNKHCITKDKFFRTGDRARLTEEGNIQILGRIKEQINRAGEKITPSEVEEALCQVSYVKEASVFGVKDEALGEKICAVLISKSQAPASDVRKNLADYGLATYKLPDEIRYVDQWPVTSVGKIDKDMLKNLF